MAVRLNDLLGVAVCAAAGATALQRRSVLLKRMNQREPRATDAAAENEERTGLSAADVLRCENGERSLAAGSLRNLRGQWAKRHKVFLLLRDCDGRWT